MHFVGTEKLNYILKQILQTVLLAAQAEMGYYIPHRAHTTTDLKTPVNLKPKAQGERADSLQTYTQTQRIETLILKERGNSATY